MARPDLRTPQSAAQAVEEAAAHYRDGRLDEAERICARVLKAWPDWFDALHLAGLLKLDTGKPAAAQALLVKALKVDPSSVPVLCNLGHALAALGRHDEALEALDRALALAPDNPEVVNNRGTILLKLGRFDGALAAFERTLAIEPWFSPARANLGSALAALGRFEEALVQYDTLLVVHPHAETLYNRGIALAALGRAADAIESYDRALALRPDYPRARIARGVALQALNRHAEALTEFGAVLRADKSNADARHNEALSLLTLGDYRRGFAAYEARWLRSGMPRQRSLGPLWLGEYPLGRKTILVHAEQGLGDTIQFVRYVPQLARGGATVVLAVQPELKALLGRLDGVASIIAQGEVLPRYDVHCPAGSLPHALGTELSSIPADVPYLKASEDHLAKWRERIEKLPQPRVAIAWAGQASHPNDHNRSIELARLAPLFGGPGSFVSIQRDLRAGDAEALAKFASVTHVGDTLADFDDTAAVLALADLTVSVDTAVVHLAGAMARTVFVLLPSQPDWRWLLDRADSPWYPTARLFRQPRPGDWESVIREVVGAVAARERP
jgi:tetratricopeptide (TPR) repeat protein